MDDLMSRALTHRFRDMFMSSPQIEVASGHISVAERAILALKDLDPRLRVSAIFRDGVGLMVIDVAVDPQPIKDIHDVMSLLVDGCPDEGLLDEIGKITADARTLSAWTCAQDGRPGWRVDGPQGPIVLCPYCQRRAGIEVKRHEA
ncbi:hypothetical protein [Agrobacterium tumefaciens]|uniref:hypothetical protein n=1 Tax=Agrobacterium tumefaciens TaxID=358 RepID=UPI003B9E91B5